ncbi:MAG: MoaD/ThiS family protein [Gemmataceae bacterium]|nr:MoaD/ThiS family protein [Gemmataceae bacterium]
MPITIEIPAPLRPHTDGAATATLAASTVREAIAGLHRQYPALAERMLDGDRLKRFLNLFVNDEDIRYLDGLETAVKDGDAVSIIPAVAGG